MLKNQLADLQKLLKRLDKADGPDDSITILEARRRREVAESRLKELEVGEREGQLLPADEVRDAVSGMIIAVRETLLRIPSELQDRLAGMSSAPACGELLEEEIRRALTNLSEYPPQKPKAPARRRKAKGKRRN